MFEVAISGSFEACHYLEAESGGAHYKTIHGHSFVVTAAFRSEKLQADGWVVDLGAAEAALKAVLARLDHKILNEVAGLEKPTFENILLWIDREIRALGLAPARIEIARPTLHQKAIYEP